MSKFKIQGVGLDTSTIKFNPENMLEDEVFGYVFTSIPANNDYLISNFINKMSGEPPLLVYTESLDNLQTALLGHLTTLKKKRANLLLIDSTKADWKFISEISNLKRDNIVSHVGIFNPLSVDDLKEKEKLLKEIEIDLEYVSFNICPLEFDVDLINYCNEKQYEIIGTNPLGGFVSAPRNINMFSIPYLLGFCANYADIVLVSGRDLLDAVEDKNYLSDLIGLNSDPGYTLKKTTKKPVKELKKAVYTSINLLGLNINVPYDDPEQVISSFDYRYKIGSYKLEPKEERFNLEDLSSDIDKITSIIDKTTDIKFSEDIKKDIEIENYLKLIYYPTDGGQGTKLAVARYKAVEYLKNIYPPEEGWNINFIKLGSSLLMVSIVKNPEIKGHLLWKRLVKGITKQYYLIIPIEGNVNEQLKFKEVVVSEREEEKEENADERV